MMMWSNSWNNLKLSGNFSNGLCLPSSGTKPKFFSAAWEQTQLLKSVSEANLSHKEIFLLLGWCGDKCATVLSGTRSRNFSALDPPDLGLGHEQISKGYPVINCSVSPVSWLLLQSFSLAGADSNRNIQVHNCSLFSARIQATKYHRGLRLYSNILSTMLTKLWAKGPPDF